MPGTAAQLGVDRYHVESNLRGGAKYLRRQLDRFGHYHLALAAYNAGPGRVRNGAVPRIPETRDYVDNRSEEHTSTPVTNAHLVCRLLLENKKIQKHHVATT